MPIKGQEPNMEENNESTTQNQEIDNQDSQTTDIQPEVSVSESPEQQESTAAQQETSHDGAPRSDAKEERQETPQQKNFRQLREQAEKLARERDEAIRVAEQLQKQYEQKKQSDATYDPDDYIEGKHLQSVEQKIKRLEEQAIENQLRSSFSDFDSVVTAENLKRLKDHDPELAESINYNPNLYSKAVAAYKAIKRNMVPDTFSKERATAQKNAAKPKPVNTIAPQQGDSPLSKANAFSEGLTEELKMQLRKEMEQARRN